MTATKNEEAENIVGSTRSDTVDFYRDTPFRLLGYANELGEAFRSWVRVGVVRLSYAIAVGYVVADTFDKSSVVHNSEVNANADERGRKVLSAAVDTLLWQGFASVIIPGFTINRICYLTSFILRVATKMPLYSRNLSATGIGLASIPLIVKPIDRLVDRVMDDFVRPVYIRPSVSPENTPCFRVATKMPLYSRNLSATGIGLASIPLIVKPIDRLVDRVMDDFVRPVYIRPSV